jgi:hypothetical protein
MDASQARLRQIPAEYDQPAPTTVSVMTVVRPTGAASDPSPDRLRRYFLASRMTLPNVVSASTRS